MPNNSLSSVPEKKYRTLQLVSNGKDAPLEIVTDKGIALMTVNQDGTVEFAEGVTFAGAVSFAEDPTFGDPGAALTAATVAAEDLTVVAPGAADYAIQALVQNTGFGFVTADEGQSFLTAVVNAILRLEELEARLVEAGIISAAE